MELWTTRIAEIDGMAALSQRAEAVGWHGITVTDSQNLAPDPFVAITLAAQATDRLQFATGVTNAFTRHPAALATVAASVQQASGGRFVLGIGRGDTSLFHLGRAPMALAPFFDALTRLQAYLSGETVDSDGYPSRIHWLGRAGLPKVSLDVAVSGPKMIAFAAGLAERVTFAVGADPDRLRWAIDLATSAAAAAGRDPAALSFGAYVNVGCHADIAVARSAIAGSVAAFAHFSAMPGSSGAGLSESDRRVVDAVGTAYDSTRHLRNDADHTAPLDAPFVDRFAVVGTPAVCADRLRELASLGIARFVVVGPGFGSNREETREVGQLIANELLPALRS